MKLMADGKTKQATKLLKADDSMAAQMEGKRLNEEADTKNKLSIEYERAFTDYASKLRADYEREFSNALIQAAAAGGLAASHPAPIERNFDPPTTPKICINAVG
eukprot:COSAG02_NODE_859_length_16438_cov_11.496236_2_plen_104_part_00